MQALDTTRKRTPTFDRKLLLLLDELPRNPMGKVTKPAVAELIGGS